MKKFSMENLLKPLHLLIKMEVELLMIKNFKVFAKKWELILTSNN
jgi:hypothetical protein